MKKIYTLITGFCLLCSCLAYGQAVSADYTTSGTKIYTIPAGYVATIEVEAWGGGGGGGGGTGGGRGGGGGGYVTNTFTNVPAGTYIITVGAGAAAGGTGGTSIYSFNKTGYCTVCNAAAGGGAGSTGNTGGTGGLISGNYDTGTEGGFGGGNSTSGCGSEGSGTGGGGGGGGGGSGASATNGADANLCNGGAGGSGDGSGGAGGNFNNSGIAGTFPGGGGGGKGGGAGPVAGAGATGRVRITVLSSVLPVELSSFNAAVNGKNVSLNWTTANEINNEKFIVESSIEGEVFSPLGEVQGAGTTIETQRYQFTHYTPVVGANYYRLKQVDFGGAFEYSKVVVVNATSTNNIRVFPNPTRGKIYMQFDQTNVDPGNLYVLDALGRRVNVEVLRNAGQYEINLPDQLSRGLYWLGVEQAGKIKMLAVMKE